MNIPFGLLSPLFQKILKSEPYLVDGEKYAKEWNGNLSNPTIISFPFEYKAEVMINNGEARYHYKKELLGLRKRKVYYANRHDEKLVAVEKARAA